MAETEIEWTHMPGFRGGVWNVMRGCSRVSEGCRNCYAERDANRFSGLDPQGKPLPYHGLVVSGPKGPRWTGAVRFVAEKLVEPLRTKTPTCWFVNSMSDVFHDGFTNEQIAALFGVMAATPRHRYLVLTKRPERMHAWFEWIKGSSHTRVVHHEVRACVLAAAQIVGGQAPGAFGPGARGEVAWPLPNVWLGVSVEDQKAADERIPLLYQTPAAIRFVSYEPALEAIDWRQPFARLDGTDWEGMFDDRSTFLDMIDWIIVGGESGPGARRFDLEWARSVVKECAEAGVACFVKQLGACAYGERDGIAGASLKVDPDVAHYVTTRLRDRAGGDMDEWPTELRVRQFPEVRHA